MTKKNLAWHFVGNTLRDGHSVPPDGVWLEHEGPIEICKSGLHFSRHPFDALQYAPGNTLCLVEIGGAIIEPRWEDKGVCSRRKIIKRGDMAELMRYFARMQALSCIEHYDNPPDVVLDYLMTGDGGIRAAAWDAARDAPRAAARDAARAAALDAARAATWDAALDAARAAAWNAARAAALDDAAIDAQREYFLMLVEEAFFMNNSERK